MTTTTCIDCASPCRTALRCSPCARKVARRVSRDARNVKGDLELVGRFPHGELWGTTVVLRSDLLSVAYSWARSVKHVYLSALGCPELEVGEEPECPVCLSTAHKHCSVEADVLVTNVSYAQTMAATEDSAQEFEVLCAAAEAGFTQARDVMVPASEACPTWQDQLEAVWQGSEERAEIVRRWGTSEVTQHGWAAYSFAEGCQVLASHDVKPTCCACGGVAVRMFDGAPHCQPCYEVSKREAELVYENTDVEQDSDTVVQPIEYVCEYRGERDPQTPRTFTHTSFLELLRWGCDFAQLEERRANLRRNTGDDCGLGPVVPACQVLALLPPMTARDLRVEELQRSLRAAYIAEDNGVGDPRDTSIIRAELRALGADDVTYSDCQGCKRDIPGTGYCMDCMLAAPCPCCDAPSVDGVLTCDPDKCVMARQAEEAYELEQKYLASLSPEERALLERYELEEDTMDHDTRHRDGYADEAAETTECVAYLESQMARQKYLPDPSPVPTPDVIPHVEPAFTQTERLWLAQGIAGDVMDVEQEPIVEEPKRTGLLDELMGMSAMVTVLAIVLWLTGGMSGVLMGVLVVSPWRKRWRAVRAIVAKCPDAAAAIEREFPAVPGEAGGEQDKRALEQYERAFADWSAGKQLEVLARGIELRRNNAPAAKPSDEGKTYLPAPMYQPDVDVEGLTPEQVRRERARQMRELREEREALLDAERERRAAILAAAEGVKFVRGNVHQPADVGEAPVRKYGKGVSSLAYEMRAGFNMIAEALAQVGIHPLITKQHYVKLTADQQAAIDLLHQAFDPKNAQRVEDPDAEHKYHCSTHTNVVRPAAGKCSTCNEPLVLFTVKYRCAIHADVVSDKADRCGVCGVPLVLFTDIASSPRVTSDFSRKAAHPIDADTHHDDVIPAEVEALPAGGVKTRAQLTV